MHSRSESGATATRDELNAQHAVWGELSTAEGTDQVLAQLKAIGSIDILVNNAGIFSVEDFFKLEDSVWLDYYQTNVMSMVRLCRALMPSMLERNMRNHKHCQRSGRETAAADDSLLDD